MRSQIVITQDDLDKLESLLEGLAAASPSDRHALEMLERELDRADVVEPGRIPPDVITMNSEVKLKDLDSGEEKVYRLVFPTQAGGGNKLSVLAPIGTALLGYRAGDVIEWTVPKGTRRLKVLKVLSQPEAQDRPRALAG